MAPRFCNTNPSKWMVLAVAALALVPSVYSAEFYLEAAASNGRLRTVNRSSARSGVAVKLGAGDSIQLTFCLRQTTVLQIRSVLYSNDGGNETVAVAVDDRSFLGTFTTRGQSDWGTLWNVFLPSPTLPRSVALPQGWHRLRVGVLPPSDGVELDSVLVWLNDEGLTKAMLDCQLLCTRSLPVVPLNNAPLWRQASVKQASYPTRCAEEDNVKVPVYVEGIMEYTVTASLPTYVSFANRREANTTDCAFLSPKLFSFKGFPRVGGSQSQSSFSATAEGAHLFGFVSHGGTKQTLRIEFVLQGRSRGHVDAEIGSILHIHFKKLPAKGLVRATYIGRTGKLTAIPNSEVAQGQTHLKLHVPDHTWRENGTNLLLVELQSSAPVDVTEVALERRHMAGETVRTVYRSDNMVLEAVEVDFWWRRPETMSLENGETGQTWRPVDFFRISLRVPWSSGFAQVFVMYQDGNVRLAPLPPPGVDWVPFGSSVIVGYSDPGDLRPSAPLTSVTFHPSILELHLRYQDGSSAKLKLSVTPTFSQIKVHDIRMGDSTRQQQQQLQQLQQQQQQQQQQELPFATLRSMFVESGNSDCDSLLVDGKTSYPIMGPWGTMRGKSFFFYRRCESQHLTMSPDIRIDVKKTSLAGTGALTSSNWWWQLYSPGFGQTRGGDQRPLSTNPYINMSALVPAL